MNTEQLKFDGLQSLPANREIEQSALKFFDDSYNKPSASREFFTGMAREVIDHPGKLAAEAVLGAVAVAGVTRFAPRLAISLYGAGFATVGYEAGKGATAFVLDKNVLDRAGIYSQTRVDDARLSLRSLGASTMDALAFGAAGVGGVEAIRLNNVVKGLRAINIVSDFGIARAPLYSGAMVAANALTVQDMFLALAK